MLERKKLILLSKIYASLLKREHFLGDCNLFAVLWAETCAPKKYYGIAASTCHLILGFFRRPHWVFHPLPDFFQPFRKKIFGKRKDSAANKVFLGGRKILSIFIIIFIWGRVEKIKPPPQKTAGNIGHRANV